ncbi:DUF6869 domain-containing protein [Thiobacillus sp.]|uniref:DUF6869 domain-containing protein n=1 Tax=Thiobacillus sp. TaxID=924 RepID=UPI00286E1531|nr:hypothetical protein [Thiobacillus sp.]
MDKRTPDQRLQAILNALKNTKADPSHHTFQNLAAGPLEDLLSDHGRDLIEQVETEARRNPNFNLLLGGVWQGGMSEEIWARIQAARLKVW